MTGHRSTAGMTSVKQHVGPMPTCNRITRLALGVLIALVVGGAPSAAARQRAPAAGVCFTGG